MILGSYLIQVASLLTLVTIIRKPPIYEGDESRTHEAKLLFWLLVVEHFIFAIVKYHATHVSQRFWDKMTICMIA